MASLVVRLLLGVREGKGRAAWQDRNRKLMVVAAHDPDRRTASSSRPRVYLVTVV